MSDDAEPGLSRRQLLAAGTTGLIGTAAVPPAAGAGRRRPGAADGTPEQVHLTWGDDPARSVVVSWASPGRALAPRVRIGQRVIPAVERGYADPRGGEVAWTYHAPVDGLRPGATYGYAVTADNDRNAADPFSATFRTAPEGRAAFRFTSFGDLTAPDAAGPGPSSRSAYAVGAVESFQPLFHLLNGDLADADPNPPAGPQAARDFANNLQASAANRPWLPVPGGHGAEPDARDRALGSYLARYSLPGNGMPGFEGRWYDVPDRHRGVPLPQRRRRAARLLGRRADPLAGGGPRRRPAGRLDRLGRDPAPPVRLPVRAVRAGADADADLGLREQWLPLFDRYEVDLVLCGHGRGYERSFPVRGFDSADTLRPHPVTTVDSGVFDTSQGTVYLVLGGGGASGGAGGGGGGDGVETPPGPRGATARPVTASRSSTSIPGPRRARRPRSPSATTTRSTPTPAPIPATAGRPTTTRSSTPSPWSGRDPTGGAGTRRSRSRRTSRDGRRYRGRRPRRRRAGLVRSSSWLL